MLAACIRRCETVDLIEYTESAARVKSTQHTCRNDMLRNGEKKGHTSKKQKRALFTSVASLSYMGTVEQTTITSDHMQVREVVCSGYLNGAVRLATHSVSSSFSLKKLVTNEKEPLKFSKKSTKWSSQERP